jgi:GNAT superfamily N-acetyltransferase
MDPQIRVLTPDDASSYREVRLRALREHPEAFATTVEEELERSVEETRGRLAAGSHQVTFGAFADSRLVGIATIVRPSRIRTRHRATIAAMYVVPEARGAGAGRALLKGCLRAAAEWQVTDVALAVTVGNDAARNLYASAGFVSYGVEPRSLRVEDRFHDVEWMNLRLR